MNELPHLGSIGEVGARTCHFEEQEAGEDEADERASRGTCQPKNSLNCREKSTMLTTIVDMQLSYIITWTNGYQCLFQDLAQEGANA